MIRLPKYRPPTHPGVHLARVLRKHGLTRTKAAQALTAQLAWDLWHQA